MKNLELTETLTDFEKDKLEHFGKFDLRELRGCQSENLTHKMGLKIAEFRHCSNFVHLGT